MSLCGKPGDFVIYTGENHSVREFVKKAFAVTGMPVNEGEGLNEAGKSKGKIVVKVNSRFYRSAEVDMLLGNYAKAKSVLGWSPKTSFKELVKIMVEADLKGLRKSKDY